MCEDTSKLKASERCCIVFLGRRFGSGGGYLNGFLCCGNFVFVLIAQKKSPDGITDEAAVTARELQTGSPERRQRESKRHLTWVPFTDKLMIKLSQTRLLVMLKD